jgi:hypothetical protein
LECLTPFQENPLASVFEQGVYKAFHESPTPKQAVQQLHAGKNTAVEIDVVRCRRNGLDQNTEPLPIFSPLDQIQPMDECVLGDYNFVDKQVSIEDPVRYARLLPYSGPRWYWKQSVQFMLDSGIIHWTDIKFKLTASAHVPHDFFRNMFATIEDTQVNVRTKDLDNISQSDFAKNCINALLGLWSKPKQYRTRVETVTYSEDLQRSGPVLKRAVEGHPTLFDYIFETELLSCTSMRPIHQVCLDMEHVFLARAYRLARKFCEIRDISAFVTDAVVCHPSAAQRKKMEVAATAIQHADGSKMFRVKQSEGCLVCTTEPPVTGTCGINVELAQ